MSRSFEAGFSPEQGIAKSCSRCGGAFSCGRDLAQCWCNSLPPLPSDEIDPQRDCLCPKCLEEATARPADSPVERR